MRFYLIASSSILALCSVRKPICYRRHSASLFYKKVPFHPSYLLFYLNLDKGSSGGGWGIPIYYKSRYMGGDKIGKVVFLS